MQAALIGPTGYTILGPAGLTIGRMQSNQYVVHDPRVSARHAVISYLKQGYFTITDPGSTNGTFVNGLLLAHNMPQILHPGDVICIGDTLLTFQISDQSQPSPYENLPASLHKNTSNQKDVRPSTRSHRKFVLLVILVSLVLLSVLTFNVFEYLNRSTPDKTLANFCKALHSKDYQSMYDQLSHKVQALGSEKLIVDDMSNVKNCTYKITKESESAASAKLTFIGLSGQLISGTILLIKDSNNMWKIDALQNI